ncbi:MAG: hypothetical protein PUP93_21715 [Rhizonema sp. NSF051]|nr:hypothetical protein [Rhizonema sp. NSF051]
MKVIAFCQIQSDNDTAQTNEALCQIQSDNDTAQTNEAIAA